MQRKKRLVFQSAIYTRSGYGSRARDFAKCLLNLPDYQVYFIPTNWGATPWTGLDENSDLGKEVKKRLVTSLNFKPDLYIQHTIPNEFQPLGHFNIGITAGIETDTCAPSWVEGINRMDIIIGSTNHSINILRDSKFNAVDKNTNKVTGFLEARKDLKFEVLHEGFNLESYKNSTPKKSVNQFIDSVDSNFCFLFVGHWMRGDLGQDRKDVGGLIKTFITTFRKKPKSKQPALILKTSGGSLSKMDKEDILNKIRSVCGDMDNAPPIYLLYGDLSDQEMISLYKHPKVKTMVSFTKGEGFGRPLAEFALTGKPVMVSGWSGQLDFILPEYHTLLEGDLKEVHESVHNDWFIKGAKWFNVDYARASQSLKDIHKNYESYLKKSKKGKSHLASLVSFENMEKNLVTILNNLDKSKEPLVKLNLPKIN